MKYLSSDRKITFTNLSLVLNKLSMQKTNTQKRRKRKKANK